MTELARQFKVRVSTRGRILSQHGMVASRKRRKRTSPWFQPFLGADHPNSVWCADFKGWIHTGDGGLSPLPVWRVKLGIMPERIKPGHPEQNGRHERLHRTLKQETMKPPAATPQDQQERCDAFLVSGALERDKCYPCV